MPKTTAQQTSSIAPSLKPGLKLEIQKDFGFLHKGDIATVTQVRKNPEGFLVVQLRTDTGKVESLTVDPRRGEAK